MFCDLLFEEFQKQLNDVFTNLIGRGRNTPLEVIRKDVVIKLFDITFRLRTHLLHVVINIKDNKDTTRTALTSIITHPLVQIKLFSYTSNETFLLKGFLLLFKITTLIQTVQLIKKTLQVYKEFSVLPSSWARSVRVFWYCFKRICQDSNTLSLAQISNSFASSFT